MFRGVTVSITITTIAVLCLLSVVIAMAQSGTLRISGDNSWVGFVNGEQVAEGSDWQQPTVSEFSLINGGAVIAVYVHDAEPGASGAGGALVDVILDDGRYFASDETWKADAGSPLADRNDGWEQPGFDDSSWENANQMDQFGSGIWGFGADTMRQVLHDPDCLAYWVWAGPNDGADDIYLRFTIGTLTAVNSKGKLSTTWAKIRAGR
jgi:hypothetical protein